MATGLTLCDDIMELVGQKVIQRRRDADRRHWVNQYNQRPRFVKTLEAQCIERICYKAFSYNSQMVEAVRMTYYAHPATSYMTELGDIRSGPMIIHMGKALLKVCKREQGGWGTLDSDSDGDDY